MHGAGAEQQELTLEVVQGHRSLLAGMRPHIASRVLIPVKGLAVA
jgi:hypothetical protein